MSQKKNLHWEMWQSKLFMHFLYYSLHWYKVLIFKGTRSVLVSFPQHRNVLSCTLPFITVFLFLKTFLCTFGQLPFSTELASATTYCQHTQGFMICFPTSLWYIFHISKMRCWRHQFMHYFFTSLFFTFCSLRFLFVCF